MNHLILGGLCTLVVILSLGFFIFVIKSLRAVDGGFGNLNLTSKILAIFLTIACLAGISTGGWFAFKNFTYKPAAKTEATKQLQEQIDKSRADGGKEYQQLIKTSDYHTAGLDQLEQAYSQLGRTTVENLSAGSEKTRAFILRNVGRNLLSKEGFFTTQLKSLSGEIVKLNDKKERVIVFADDSEYSLNLLSYLHEKASESDDDASRLRYTIIFPTLDGTKIDAFFKNNTDKLGSIDQNSVVSIDSQPNQANLSIYAIATQEYHVTDLPSYLAIDKNGIISLAGVGSVIDSRAKLDDWLNSAFNSKNKLYNEIERGVDSDKKGVTDSSSESVSEESAPATDSGTETTATEGGGN